MGARVPQTKGKTVGVKAAAKPGGIHSACQTGARSQARQVCLHPSVIYPEADICGISMLNPSDAYPVYIP